MKYRTIVLPALVAITGIHLPAADVAPTWARIQATATIAAKTRTPLPPSVYADFADIQKSVINMPPGDYYLPAPLKLSRSGVTVNFAGCKLYVDPADGANSGFYPIKVSSTSVTSPTYLPSPAGSGPGVRFISHARGTILAATTTLTMDPHEVVALTPGETVLIWAGVTPTDPVEPQAFLPATVQSVDTGTGVITFTAPLGKDITNYGSLSALAAKTDPSLTWKVGDWGTYPSQANFSKGYGFDHGIERFVGGMVHDVTLNDPELNLDPVGDISRMPNGMWDISAVAVRNFTLNRARINNPCGSILHFWRAFNVLVDGVTITGAGLSKIWNTSTSESWAVTIWGGDRYKFRGLSISGTDIALTNVEVGPTNIWIDGVACDVTFTSGRTYGGSPVIFGFPSIGDVPRVTNATIRAVTTGGSQHIYFSYPQLILDGSLSFPGTSLTSWFDWGFQRSAALEGSVTIGGVTYGPAVTQTLNYAVLHGAGYRDIKLPAGLYTSASFVLQSKGDLRGVTDSFGNNYWTSAQGGGVTNLAPEKWLAIPPGESALGTYSDKFMRFWLNDAGSTADASVKFTVTYLPKKS